MKKNKSCSKAKVNVPVSWRILSIFSMLPFGMILFYVIFSKSGGKFPLAAGDSTDPYFFGFLFAVLIPAIVYIFIVDKILKGIVMRRPGKDIAKDVAVDVAKTAAVMAAEIVVDAALGGSSAGSSSSSSSGGGTKGGGGEFGGGGASGGY
ncbi:MAG: hypothetical protein WA610_02775 [Thermodesulfovibrionales bacterium]